MPLIRIPGKKTLELRDALVQAFPGPQFAELLLLMDQTFGNFSVAEYSFDQNVLVTIRKAEAESWLLDLVSQASDLRAADPVLWQIKTELSALAPPPGIDLYEVCHLTGGFVMIDRAKLRTALRGMSSPLGKRILIVKGGPKTGKSHTLQLLSFLAKARESGPLVVLDLEAFRRILGSSALIEPWDLGERLLRLMSYDLKLPERPVDAQWARWVLQFCDGFEARAAADPKERWIVIDALNSVLLAQPTFDLIKELAHRINVSLTQLRLVLLGYSDSLPPAVLPHVEEEQISAIGEKELIDFFFRAYQQLSVSFDEDRVADAVARVLDQLDPSQPDFLVQLGPRASEELARAKAPKGGS